MWIILIVLLTGEVKTLVGGRQGFADGVGKKAKFYHPTGLSLDVHSGILYVADHVRILSNLVPKALLLLVPWSE